MGSGSAGRAGPDVAPDVVPDVVLDDAGLTVPTLREAHPLTGTTPGGR
jgi:hypothetical protein